MFHCYEINVRCEMIAINSSSLSQLLMAVGDDLKKVTVKSSNRMLKSQFKAACACATYGRADECRESCRSFGKTASVIASLSEASVTGEHFHPLCQQTLANVHVRNISSWIFSTFKQSRKYMSTLRWFTHHLMRRYLSMKQA
jgi:hypothetical protein